MFKMTYMSLSALGKIPWRLNIEKVRSWRPDVEVGGGLVGETDSELGDR